MSRIPTPPVESAAGATAELFARIRKAADKVPNTFATIGAHGPARPGGRTGRWLRHAFLISAMAFSFAATSPALARSRLSHDPPSRIANIYDFYDHQPTRQEVESAEAAAGIAAPSQSQSQVEEEVQELLRQIHELDHTFDDHSARRHDH